MLMVLRNILHIGSEQPRDQMQDRVERLSQADILSGVWFEIVNLTRMSKALIGCVCLLNYDKSSQIAKWLPKGTRCCCRCAYTGFLLTAIGVLR